MAEPNRTVARPLTAVPDVEGAWTMPLTHGGDLTITEHDGEYTLHLTRDGESFTRRLSVMDIWAFRSMTGNIVIGRLQEQSA